MALTIAQAVRKIIIREPFYGLFLLGLNKYFDDSIPTACVRKRGIYIELAINKANWDSLDEETEINELLHEANHIIFKHLWMWHDFPDKERFNIAADCVVNSYLKNVPDDWYLPKDFGFDNGKGTKWYYENLPKNETEKRIIDDHSWEDFKNLSDAEKQLLSNQIDYQVKTTAEEVIKTQGKLPGHLEEYIKSLFKEKDAVFNWKAYFRRVIGNSIRTYIKSTKYKPSRRFKEQPGITLKFKPKVLVAIDTSASVTNNELIDFFTEVDHLYKSGVHVDVMEFDTQIQNKFVYKGQKTDIKIVGRGGTDASDVYNYYIENPDYSTLVIFTDGYLNVNYPKHKNMIWIISSEGQRQDYPGLAIYIPKQK